MTQETFADWSITSSNNTTVTGDAAALDINEGMLPGLVNDAMRAIMSAAVKSWGGMHSGSTRPTAVPAARFWLDTTSATAPILTWYDGTDDIAFATINYTTNIITIDSAVVFAGVGLGNVVEDTTPQLGGMLDVNGQAIGNGTLELLTFVEDASAVNNVEIENEATGSPPIIRAVGDDAVVGLIINTKSTGTLDLQTGGTSRIDLTASGVRLGAANARATTILDEDAMGSDSATALATQQSIKAYVDSQSGLTRGTAVATTSGTSVDFGSIPAAVDLIIIMLAGVSTDGSSDYLIQIGDAGGIEVTGYDSAAFSSGGNSTDVTGFLVVRLNSAAEVSSGQVVLSRQDGNLWVSNGGMKKGTVSISNAGDKTLSAELTQIRLTTVNGTDVFDAGSLNIMYL